MTETASEVATIILQSSVRRIRDLGSVGMVILLLGAAIGVVVALLLPPQYTSSASFIAQGASTSLLPTAFQGIAASMGLGAARDFSPQFYADLLTSRPVMAGAVHRRYDIPSHSPTTYVDIYNLGGPDSALALEKALKHLHRRLATRADPRTNIITVSVAARDPYLSRDILQALLASLDSLNIGFRREQSRELREFFESRVEAAQQDLGEAEDALRAFLQRNRVIQTPDLQFEQIRLTRVADLKRAVYMTVVQQFEEAKLQESRNVPILTVLSAPVLPVKRSGPPRRLVVALALGLAFALAYALPWIGRTWVAVRHELRGTAS